MTNTKMNSLKIFNYEFFYSLLGKYYFRLSRCLIDACRKNDNCVFVCLIHPCILIGILTFYVTLTCALINVRRSLEGAYIRI